jgi:two-component system cell cycle response regulator DivK
MKKILIVEDVDLNIELLTQLLEDDYALAIAKDGEQGVAQATSERPDLILTKPLNDALLFEKLDKYLNA